ncbi:MAG: response regulator [Proteobacteria bacterium]|nr:response regulator [Pseudomonadota bacterium]
MQTETPKILIIDDSAANLEVASAHLKQYAYTVLTARDGLSGVKRAHYARPDLILLDIDMPGIDGFETCRRLKAHPDTIDIPVLYMTAYSGSDDKLRAFELGGVDYITKPFEASELLARVRTHLTLTTQRKLLAGEAERLELRIAQATADRDRLLDMVRLQGDQVRALTQHWMERRSNRDRDLAEVMRRQLSERLEMVRNELLTARADTTGQLKERLDRALELLGPALQTSGDVEGRLVTPDPEAESPFLRLSTREHQVFQLLIDGKSNKEIAGALSLAPTTVSTYRLRVLEKLDVADVPALVRLAFHHPM